MRPTIVSSDDSGQASNANAQESNATGESNKSQDEANNPPEENPLHSIGAMYAAFRACGIPPPTDSVRHGMEYTIRLPSNAAAKS